MGRDNSLTPVIDGFEVGSQSNKGATSIFDSLQEVAQKHWSWNLEVKLRDQSTYGIFTNEEKKEYRVTTQLSQSDLLSLIGEIDKARC